MLTLSVAEIRNSDNRNKIIKTERETNKEFYAIDTIVVGDVVRHRESICLPVLCYKLSMLWSLNDNERFWPNWFEFKFYYDEIAINTIIYNYKTLNELLPQKWRQLEWRASTNTKANEFKYFRIISASHTYTHLLSNYVWWIRIVMWNTC